MGYSLGVTFNWSDQKNELLKQTRGISFEEIVIAIEEGNIFDVVTHPNAERYPQQQIYLVVCRHYVYAVPFVRDISKEEIFLKTIYPSRKYTKRYRSPEEET